MSETGSFMVSDELLAQMGLDAIKELGFEVIKIESLPTCTVVHATSEHFKDGPGLYNIIMQKDEGKEPYVLRAELVEEVSNAIQ